MAQGNTHHQPILPAPVTSGLSHPPMNFQKPASPFAYSIPLQILNSSSQQGNVPTFNDDYKSKRTWKFQGYNEFSKWMSSDDDFFVFRRFGQLNAGVVLWMQDRISQIEKRLEQIHNEIANSPDDRRNSSFRWDVRNVPERDRLMCELSGLLHHYNQYVETYSNIRTRPKAELRQINNVKNWLTRKAITPAEQDFVNHEGDLIAVSSRVRPPLGRLIEASRLIRLSRFFRRKFLPDVQVLSEYTHYSSDEALEILTGICVILFGFLMLLGPLWWLEFVSDSKKRLGIISGFLLVFMVLMTAATVNRPFEVVASTAAYGAVLMVFMQIGGH